nr:hypothetical protein [Oscillospiraceae bacterium]
MYKRILVLFFAASFFFSIFSTTVYATDVTQGTNIHASRCITKNDIERIAIGAFPEYASKILEKTTTLTLYDASSLLENTTVICETRTISDSETITYQEYSNGTYSLLFSSYSSTESSTVSGNITAVNKTIWATYSLSSDVNYIENLCYHIVSDAYDYITNTGSPWGTSYTPMRGSTKLNETASSAAYVDYTCQFIVNIGLPEGEHNTVQSAILRISVGSNSFSMSFR